jgi:hypothetical protein
VPLALEDEDCVMEELESAVEMAGTVMNERSESYSAGYLPLLMVADEV